MDIDTENDLETKAGYSPDAILTHGEFMGIWEAFKASNEERLAQIARNGAVDALTEQKNARINAALDRQQRQIDELSLRHARPSLGRESTGVTPAAAREHKAAFEAYIRRGDATVLRELEVKALSVGSGPDGGYLVPREIETEIGARLKDISPIRSLASVRTVSGNVYKKPFMTSAPAVGWVGEAEARTQTNSPVLDELSFPVMELYAMPAATATLLEDSAVNIDQWIASEVDLAFAAQEGTAFVNGDGDNKPNGFLSYETVANASWVWKKIGYIATGQAGAAHGRRPIPPTSWST
jgi:HK97 family phage major capsid protein